MQYTIIIIDGFGILLPSILLGWFIILHFFDYRGIIDLEL